MRRKLRIIRIWAFGRLPLTKRIHKKIVIDILLQHIKGIEHLTTINPYAFNEIANTAQKDYWRDIIDSGTDCPTVGRY